ncbi:DUF3224 domain-containing protein [Candidatus Villigracilis affinis]|uniref:DUF3224 domain-containing protein n=1 Tax=Candidatus Villigracilis affinis TaxID=3140682 RepID=UPI002A192E58|nr:DUF3224 domain-containing protein [Anaerolineales bacterium]
MKANGTFTVKKWDERSDQEISSDTKTTKASVEYVFTGEAEGLESVEYLMFYKHFDSKNQHNSSSIFVGLLRFSGKLSGKEGSFFVEERGTFENGMINSKFNIITGSGLGELQQISGTGFCLTNQDGSRFEFEYNL